MLSACTEWTVADVAGHLIWGEHQMRVWRPASRTPHRGAPGTPHPATSAGTDPAATGGARGRMLAVLTDEALARTATITGMGEVPLGAMVTVWVVDTTTHRGTSPTASAWRSSFSRSGDASYDWARANVVRRPGFFGPELTPPDSEDEQTRIARVPRPCGLAAVPA